MLGSCHRCRYPFPALDEPVLEGVAEGERRDRVDPHAAVGADEHRAGRRAVPHRELLAGGRLRAGDHSLPARQELLDRAPHPGPVDAPLAAARRVADRQHRGHPQERHPQHPHLLQELVQLVLVVGREHVHRLNRHAVLEQPVHRLDHAPPTARHPPRRVVNRGRGPVHGHVHVEPRDLGHPGRNLVVHEPAVRVQGDPHARIAEAGHRLQREVLPQQRLAARDHRLDHAQVDDLPGHRPVLLVGHLGCPGDRVARGVCVTEPTPQIARVGHLQLRAHGAHGNLGDDRGLAVPPGPARETPKGEALLAHAP